MAIEYDMICLKANAERKRKRDKKFKNIFSEIKTIEEKK